MARPALRALPRDVLTRLPEKLRADLIREWDALRREHALLARSQAGLDEAVARLNVVIDDVVRLARAADRADLATLQLDREDCDADRFIH